VSTCGEGRSQKAEVRRQRSGVRTALVLSFVLGLTHAAEIKVTGGAQPVKVSVVRRVDVAYSFATRQSPLQFEVQGPTWLRVYVRLWWPSGATGARRYGLVLKQDESERPVEFETGVSPTTFGPRGHKLGEWRSFFVQVPAGTARYSLAVTGAETVAVRLALQAPRPWESVEIGGARKLTLAEGSDTTGLYECDAGQSLAVALSGPCRVRVRARLSFEPGLPGAQNFVVTVTEDKTELARRNLKVARSPSASFVEEGGVVPSTERTLRFNLGAGEHMLLVGLGGTLAKWGALAIEVIPGEKYE
jgi:hypothetical protein